MYLRNEASVAYGCGCVHEYYFPAGGDVVDAVPFTCVPTDRMIAVGQKRALP